jgi:hypothetical protein
MTSLFPSSLATQPQDVVSFWLDAGPQQWFTKNAGFDAVFRERFEGAHFAAAARRLDGWLDDADGALALMILPPIPWRSTSPTAPSRPGTTWPWIRGCASFSICLSSMPRTWPRRTAPSP